MPSLTYPLDITGLSATNLIAEEVHTLTEINSSTYRILIPEFAPFYLDNLELKHVDSSGVTTVLTEGADYFLCLPYIGATRSIGKMIYGGISINTLLINGVVKLTYQTLGGEWNADANYVLTRLAETIYNPRITVWDSVTNKTNQFPPTNHDQHMDYIFGHGDLIASINDLANTIGSGPSNANGTVTHILREDNPHLTNKDQVGLGLVENYPVTTVDNIVNKVAVDEYVLVKHLVESGMLDSVAVANLDILNHKNDLANPHQVTKAQVGLSEVENYPVASSVDVASLALVDKYVTLKQLITVNSSQIPNIPTATDAEVAALLPIDKYITLRQLVNIIFTVANPIPTTTALIPHSEVVDNGTNLLFTLNITSIPIGTLFWVVDHISTDNDDFNMLSGNVNLSGYTTQFVVPIASSNVYEGTEQFTISIRLDTIDGSIVVSSPVVTIRRTAYSDDEAISYRVACCIYDPSIDVTPESLYLIADDDDPDIDMIGIE